MDWELFRSIWIVRKSNSSRMNFYRLGRFTDSNTSRHIISVWNLFPRCHFVFSRRVSSFFFNLNTFLRFTTNSLWNFARYSLSICKTLQVLIWKEVSTQLFKKWTECFFLPIACDCRWASLVDCGVLFLVSNGVWWIFFSLVFGTAAQSLSNGQLPSGQGKNLHQFTESVGEKKIHPCGHPAGSEFRDAAPRERLINSGAALSRWCSFLFFIWFFWGSLLHFFFSAFFVVSVSVPTHFNPFFFLSRSVSFIKRLSDDSLRLTLIYVTWSTAYRSLSRPGFLGRDKRAALFCFRFFLRAREIFSSLLKSFSPHESQTMRRFCLALIFFVHLKKPEKSSWLGFMGTDGHFLGHFPSRISLQTSDRFFTDFLPCLIVSDCLLARPGFGLSYALFATSITGHETLRNDAIASLARSSDSFTRLPFHRVRGFTWMCASLTYK